MRVLILAFQGTIAEHVANKLRTPADKVYLHSDRNWLERFVADTDFSKYDYILTIGSYSGRDKESIRTETECTSQFRNQRDNLHRLAIPYYFKPEPPFKLSSGIGNSWCNLLSYQILSKMPNARFTFLHIPKDFDVDIASRAIDKQLLSLPRSKTNS